MNHPFLFRNHSSDIVQLFEYVDEEGHSILLPIDLAAHSLPGILRFCNCVYARLHTAVKNIFSNLGNRQHILQARGLATSF